VTNPVANLPTTFTLTDTLAFGANITIHSATITAVGNAPSVSPTWNGTTDTTVVSNGPLGPGATEHYTVTVNATVLGEATASDRDCSEGGGFRSRAGVALPAATTADPEVEACADPGSPTITKKVVSVVAGATAGQWVITYDITVANGTGIQLSYSQNDQLGYPSGITITSTSAGRVHSALNGSGTTATQPIPGWTGTVAGITLATNQQIPAQSKDTYTVVVGATVPSGLADAALACSTAGPGHGYFNAATLTSGSDRASAQACASITPTPSPAPAPTPAPTTPAPPPPSGPLPVTGLILKHFVVTALALLGGGIALVGLSRRNRSRRRASMHIARHTRR
jgi:hypothetical protein